MPSAGRSEATDNVMPEGRWSFDGDVTAVFDDMLSRSIPQYEVMRRAVFEAGSRFVKPGTAVVDLGSSRGEAAQPLIDRFGAHNRFVLVEVSPPMLEVLRERYKGLVNCGVVDVRDLDLRRDYPPVVASLTQAILTIQFTPIEHRQRILRDVFQNTDRGGAFVMVEKVLGDTAEIDAVMVELYYKMKAENGYSPDEIERKRLSLEGVLVPVTARFNEMLLRGAGFDQVDCIWRWMNFAAWLAVKE